jgi:acyl-CoA synthetase (AMP-forming)/AMP-acid ligase II
LTEPVFPDFPATVPGLLRAGVDRWPDRDCVVTPDARLTYADLDSSSKTLAARLVDAGVSKATRVGVMFPNGIPWIVAWAAAARIGAVVIPINTFSKSFELERLLRHADVHVLLGVASFIQHDYLERLETIAPELTEQDGSALRLPNLPQLRRVMLWGESDRRWADGGLATATATDAELAIVERLEDDVTPSDELVVTYTSGSTGEPKGVVLGHGPLIRHARNLASLSGIDSTSRNWTPMPLCWVGGFAYTLVRSMTVGGAFVTQEVFEPGAALHLMEAERVTHVSAWPAACKSLAQHPRYAETDLSAIQGGAFYDAIPVDRRPPDPSLLVTSLGMSETCGPHTFWTADVERTGAPREYAGTFGREVPGTEHRIVDPETGQDLAPGVEGEVLVRGYSLMLGMYKRERSEVFDADGWYHTGDRGYFRDGWFFFTGRQSDLIKTAGSNVAPAEVEGCLLTLDGIKLAFVVGVAHPDRGEDVVAMVVGWDASDPVDPSSVRDQVRERLSSYKVPRHVFVIGDLDVPWLTSQKADRRALGALAAKLVASVP